MKIKNIIMVLVLTGVWILLCESFSVAIVLSGLFFSTLTLIICYKALPMEAITDVRLTKLALYPFFLIGEVYKAGFHVIKLIFTGATVEIVELETKLQSETLRIILADSITLTPGSILIKLDGSKFHVLWLRSKAEANLTQEERDHTLKGPMEQLLLRAQQ